MRVEVLKQGEFGSEESWETGRVIIDGPLRSDGQGQRVDVDGHHEGPETPPGGARNQIATGVQQEQSAAERTEGPTLVSN